MALFLVQHGLSLPKAEDPEKGLSPEGINDTLRIAQVAAGYKIAVHEIVHSSKKRAVETARIFHDHLSPETGLMQVSGINPMDSIEAFKETLDPVVGRMVVGHLPFMEKLVALLTTGHPDTMVYKFQNSGIVCLDCENGNWFIKWTLNPNIS